MQRCLERCGTCTGRLRASRKEYLPLGRHALRRARGRSAEGQRCCTPRAVHSLGARYIAMSAAGAGKPATAPAREATCELASDTSAGHAASGLLMLQPNAPPPMYAPMHQVPVTVPEPHAPLSDRLPRSAAPPIQMPAGVLMRAGPGHGLPPPITTPLAHMHMASPHPSVSSRAAGAAGAALKRPLNVMNVRPRPCPRHHHRCRRRRHHHHDHHRGMAEAESHSQT